MRGSRSVSLHVRYFRRGISRSNTSNSFELIPYRAGNYSTLQTELRVCSTNCSAVELRVFPGLAVTATAAFLSWHKYPGEKRLPNVAGIMKTHKLRFRAVAFCSRSSRLSIDKRQCELFQTFIHNVVASLRETSTVKATPPSSEPILASSVDDRLSFRSRRPDRVFYLHFPFIRISSIVLRDK